MVNICPLLLIHLLLQLNNLHLLSITSMKRACVFINTCSPLYCDYTVLTFYLDFYFMTHFTSLCDVCLRLAKQPIPTVSKSFSHLLKIDIYFFPLSVLSFFVGLSFHGKLKCGSKVDSVIQGRLVGSVTWQELIRRPPLGYSY